MPCTWQWNGPLSGRVSLPAYLDGTQGDDVRDVGGEGGDDAAVAVLHGGGQAQPRLRVDLLPPFQRGTGP